MIKNKKCDCNFCKDWAEHKKLIDAGSIDDLKKNIKELFEAKYMALDELNYCQSILDGSWPSSVRILRASLDKAIEIHKDEMIKEVEDKLDRKSCFISDF